MKLLITGGTGFVGRRLCETAARRGHILRVTTRDADRAPRALQGAEFVEWDPGAAPLPPAALEGIEGVIHLAGENIASGRWTTRKKNRIRDSRVLGTRHLVDAILAAPRKPGVFVGTSAIGWYAPRGDEPIEESSGAPGSDFLAEVCRDWEAEERRAEAGGLRLVILRCGVILGHGGALRKMLPPFQMGLGGRIGSGEQWMSWIHIDDVVGLYLEAAENRAWSGVYNAVAPEPARNLEFTKTLGRVLGRPTVIPMPYFLLRVLAGPVAQVIVADHRVLPARLRERGHAFRYPALEPALAQILAPAP